MRQVATACAHLRPCDGRAKSANFSTTCREELMRLMLQAGVVAGVIGVLAMPLSPARAQADFYKGKTVAIVIGAKTGSLAVAAQLVGRHLGKHIPGNPTVINRQMPGGAHLNATNHIFNVAAADGLTVLAANA